MFDDSIVLCEPGEDGEPENQVEVFATKINTGRDEFSAAGERGYKKTIMFEVQGTEYEEQPELIYGKKRLSIYRTYGPREDGLIELYAAERVGNRYGA